MKTMFANITITNLDGVKEAVKTYKSFVPTTQEEADSAWEALQECIENANTDLKNAKISEIVNADDIIAALVPVIEITDAERLKSNTRKMKVALAVAYPQFIVTESKEDGITYREIATPVTLANIVKYLVDLYAFGNADGRPTKANREKALRKVFNGNARSLALFTTGAFAYENIADKLPSLMGMTEEEAQTFGGTPSKAKAEKQIKALATAFGIDATKFKRIHGLALYKKCYTLDNRMQPRTVDGLQEKAESTTTVTVKKTTVTNA